MAKRITTPKMQKQKGRAKTFSVLAVVFFIIACILLFIAFRVSVKNVDDIEIPSSPNITTGAATTPSVEVVAITSSENLSDSDPVTSSSTTTVSNKLVPESQAKDLSYLSDAVFLGDSITEGMDLYNQSDATVVAYKGLTTSQALTKALEKYNDQTAVQAVKAAHPKKIYVLFGSNEIAGIDLEIFRQKYNTLIETLKVENPDATIFIQSIPPVTLKYETKGEYLNNALINQANEYVKLVAEDQNVYFLDLHGALVDTDGALPENESPVDGAHFGKEAFGKWFNYLLTHTI